MSFSHHFVATKPFFSTEISANGERKHTRGKGGRATVHPKSPLMLLTSIHLVDHDRSILSFSHHFVATKPIFFQQRWSRRDYTHPFVAGTALQAVVVAQEVQFASPFAEDDEDDGAQDHQRDDDTAEHDAPH